MQRIQAPQLGLVLADLTALPASPAAGTVNVGQPIATGASFAGLRVWRRTVVGWFPAAGVNVSNVNGTAQGYLFTCGAPGHVVATGGWINRAGANQHHLFSALPANGDHLHPVYLIVNTNPYQVGLWNTLTDTTFNGAEFHAWIDYTDSNNP